MKAKYYYPVFFLGILFPGFQAHAAKVYVEFEGLVTTISQKTLLPDVSIGDKITGHYVVNADQAPADTFLFDPNFAIYSDTDTNPAPSTFIEATAVIDGRTFQSTEYDAKATQWMRVFDGGTDSYDIWEATSRSSNSTAIFYLQVLFDSAFLDLGVMGDNIVQNINWTIEPGNTNPPKGEFIYRADLDTGIHVGFGITIFKVGDMLPPVDLGGTVKTPGGLDICAMVLASGKFMFSCNPNGILSLTDLPRETNGTVKRQIYADGFFPKIDVLNGTTDEAVVLTPSGPCPSYNPGYDPAVVPNSAGRRINISGKVLTQDTQTPICAMVLANGQFMFSCDGSGNYTLNIPLDNNGQYKLQVYADGFAPTIQTFDEFKAANNVRMARATECQ